MIEKWLTASEVGVLNTPTLDSSVLLDSFNNLLVVSNWGTQISALMLFWKNWHWREFFFFLSFLQLHTVSPPNVNVFVCFFVLYLLKYWFHLKTGDLFINLYWVNLFFIFTFGNAPIVLPDMFRTPVPVYKTYIAISQTCFISVKETRPDNFVFHVSFSSLTFGEIPL